MANKGYSQYGGNPYASSGNYDGYGSQMQQQPSGASSSYPAPGREGITPYQTESTYSQPGGYYGSSQPAQSSGGYGQSNPYGSSAAQSHGQGYGSSTGRTQATPSQLEQGQSSTSGRGYGAPAASGAILSNQDFLSRVEGTRSDIRTLTSNVAEIGSLHQRALSNTDSSTGSSSQLEHLVSQTSILNTRIKDQIKRLEADAARDLQKNGRQNTTKESQVKTLKSNFQAQLKDYQGEEKIYRQRYRDQIARQYRIVNPQADESEVREATEANWNDEGVFQTALKTNRTGAATSVLGAVRARHNDIQHIEATITELATLFEQLNEQVILQEEPIRQAEEKTQTTVVDQKNANVQLDKGIKSARNVKKMKWWCLGIAVLIVIILGLVLGLYFGLHNKNNNNNGK